MWYVDDGPHLAETALIVRDRFHGSRESDGRDSWRLCEQARLVKTVKGHVAVAERDMGETVGFHLGD